VNADLFDTVSISESFLGVAPVSGSYLLLNTLHVLSLSGLFYFASRCEVG